MFVCNLYFIDQSKIPKISEIDANISKFNLSIDDTEFNNCS